MSWVLSACGAVLVLVVLRDIFHTLFHPVGRGSITRAVMRSVWWLCSPVRRWRRLSGPLGMACVIAAWGALTTLGWALVYLAHMPDGFAFVDQSGEGAGFLDALYFSLVAVATLGFGDIVPTAPVMRLVAPMEAIVGFMLFTAAVSWVLQVYPALTRRRALALRLAALRRADGLPGAAVLHDVAAGVVQLRVDLTQYGVTYYFRDDGTDTSIALAMLYAADLAETSATDPDTRLAVAVLGEALADLARLLDRSFLRTGGDTRAVLRAWGGTA